MGHTFYKHVVSNTMHEYSSSALRVMLFTTRIIGEPPIYPYSNFGYELTNFDNTNWIIIISEDTPSQLEYSLYYY